jgi:hypothetical protein
VEASIEILKTNFSTKCHRNLQQGEARHMMLAYIGARDYPLLAVRGKNISTTQQRELVEEAIRVVGEQIQSFIATTLQEGQTTSDVAASLKSVFLVGRGSLFYADYLEATLGSDLLKRVEHPDSDNAYGYAMFSKRGLLKTMQIVS